jgi:hypothetical protein
VAGEGPFQERVAQNLLAGRFLTDYYAMVARWARWATTVVEAWPDDPREAKADPRELEEVVRRATW